MKIPTESINLLNLRARSSSSLSEPISSHLKNLQSQKSHYDIQIPRNSTILSLADPPSVAPTPGGGLSINVYPQLVRLMESGEKYLAMNSPAGKELNWHRYATSVLQFFALSPKFG